MGPSWAVGAMMNLENGKIDEGKTMCEEEIEKITPEPFPYDPDKKMFRWCECEEPCDHPLESYNDWIEKFKSISGVNEDLLGSAEPPEDE